MAKAQPANHRDFAQLHGVGDAKLERFADVFIEEIRRHAEDA